jgi:hypothetical protein
MTYAASGLSLLPVSCYLCYGTPIDAIMISAVFLFIFLLAFSVWYAQVLSEKHSATNLNVFKWLIGYHTLISFVYYLYALFNRSDSHRYYWVSEVNYRGSNWFDYYGVSTSFVEFLGYPFIKYLGFSYEAMMMLFAWFGLMGFFFFYIVLKERLKYEHTFFGYSLLTIVLFLPNLHFWSGSFGKGSIIFLGFGLFFYALNNVNKRWIVGIIGAVIIYHVRPHILFVVLIASAWGFAFSFRGVSLALRTLVVLISIGAVYYIKEDVLALTGIDEESFFEDTTTLDMRATSLMKAGSGVDITGYSFPMKVFTFWFRPLFVDAPGILGWIVSFENLFYLIIFSKLFRWSFIDYFRRSDHVVKASFLTFLGVSFALAQITGNLGLAMRQKSQVMILMMFVILKFLDEQRHWQEERAAKEKKIKENRAAVRQRRLAALEAEKEKLDSGS